MAYADYTYYSTVYMGAALAEGVFPALAVKASAYVDYVTMGRAKNAAGDAADAVKNAVCALCEIINDGSKLNAASTDTERSVSSETVGAWTRSFGSKNVSGTDVQLIESRKREAVVMYLAPYGLLRARGYGPCPCSPTL